MRRSLAAAATLAAACVFQFNATPADACGVKLTINTSAPRHAVAHSSNPSHVLLLGSHPHKLERSLQSAGHDVEVEQNADSAKRGDYAVVVTDQEGAPAARAKFGDDRVVVTSGDEQTDARLVEDKVARRPVQVAAREPKNVQERRSPIAAGPNNNEVREPINAKPTEGAGEPTKAAPKPEKVAKAEPAPPPVEKATPPPPPVEKAAPPPPPVEKAAPPPPPEKHVTAKVEPKTETAPPVESKPKAFPTNEVYFSLGSSKASKTAQLSKVAKYLTDNPSVSVTVEGYADPTGTPEGNMALSQQRAESVRDVLSGAGVDSSRMDIQPYGDTKLKYGSKDGRNRRVTVVPKP